MNTNKKLWLKIRRTWLVFFFLICFSLFISTFPNELPRNVAYLAKAYLEPEIAEGVLAIAKKNPKIIALLGKLEPMGKMTMLEGSVGYSKDGDSVAITIGIRGDKKEKKIRSNMDVLT